jgi:hypothetical protein
MKVILFKRAIQTFSSLEWESLRPLAVAKVASAPTVNYGTFINTV